MTREQEFALKHLGSRFHLHSVGTHCYYYAEDAEAARNAKTAYDLIYKQNYCLFIVPVSDDGIRISTKNRYGTEYSCDFKVKDIVSMEKAIQDQLTQLKLGKIKKKLRDIEKDFLPYETPDYDAFFPYITDIVT